MSKVDQDELQKSLQYLDEFEKGQSGMQIDQNANGGKEEKISQYKEKLNCHIQKAKKYKEALDKLEKGEDADVMEDEEEMEKSSKKDDTVKKGNDVEEIRKSIEASVISKIEEKFDTLIKGKNDEIETLRKKVEEIEKTPVRKSIVKSAQAVVLEKALKGETSEDGKVLLSRKLQKGRVSEVLFKAWEDETDEIKKAKYGDAVVKFESTGSYIEPSVIQELFKSKNIQIID